MTLGRVRLDDGAEVTGFFCQASATEGAADISVLGGWRRYLEQAAVIGEQRQAPAVNLPDVVAEVSEVFERYEPRSSRTIWTR